MGRGQTARAVAAHGKIDAHALAGILHEKRCSSRKPAKLGGWEHRHWTGHRQNGTVQNRTDTEHQYWTEQQTNRHLPGGWR